MIYIVLEKYLLCT